MTVAAVKGSLLDFFAGLNEEEEEEEEFSTSSQITCNVIITN